MPPVASWARRELVVEGRLDLHRTLAVHRRALGDPTMRFGADGTVLRATRTPAGPATLLIEPAASGLRASGWGPGAAAALDALGALVGLEDDPTALVPRDRLIAELARRFAGVRIGRTDAVIESLVPAVLEQKVTGDEAHRAFRRLVRWCGEPAPGPGGLFVPPTSAVLAALPYHGFHPFGVERRRAETVRRVAREAARLEGTATLARAGRLDDAYAVLRSIPGIGAWTAAEVGLRAFGDPDAVSVGDFHTPNLVAWALAGEPRGTDERMLELLEPYRGQRGRVVRLLELSGIEAPRYGPRLAPRRIERL